MRPPCVLRAACEPVFARFHLWPTTNCQSRARIFLFDGSIFHRGGCAKCRLHYRSAQPRSFNQHWAICRNRLAKRKQAMHGKTRSGRQELRRDESTIDFAATRYVQRGKHRHQITRWAWSLIPYNFGSVPPTHEPH